MRVSAPGSTLPENLVAVAYPRWGDEGLRWLERLPEQVLTCIERWDLKEVREVQPGGLGSFVAYANWQGERVVLKISCPEGGDDEILALGQWAGNGAASLLAAHRDDGTFLMERVEPGDRLTLDHPDPINAVGSVIEKLQERAALIPITTTEEIWKERLERLHERYAATGEPFSQELLQETEGRIRHLLASAPEPTLIHGDLHPGNIMLSPRGYLTIDPLAQIGELGYDAAYWAMMVHREEGVLLRAAALADRLGIDTQRVKLWASVIAADKVFFSIELGRDFEVPSYLSALLQTL